MNTQNNYETIRIQKDLIPRGSKLVEAYETATQIVVCGEPPAAHNCDAMGCGTLSHVIYRFEKAV